MTQETIVNNQEPSNVPESSTENTDILHSREENTTPQPEEEVKETQEAEQEQVTDYDLKLPEDALLKETALKDVVEFAKENKLSNEQAQSILEKQNQAVSEYIEGLNQEQAKQSDAWKEEVINDKVLGGDNLEKTTKIATNVLERFASEELISILRDTGYGNNPELVKFLYSIGNTMQPDTLILPKAKASSKTIEEVFYGNN